MKKKITIFTLVLFALLAISILSIKSINSIHFFRSAQKITIESSEEAVETKANILLYPVIDMHQFFLEKRDEIKIVENFFSEPLKTVADSEHLTHAYIDSHETDEFKINFALIEQDSNPSNRFNLVWQITPKKKNIRLSSYDFKISSHGSFLWELENNKNNMLIRYPKQETHEWIQVPVPAGMGVFPNDFPERYWNKVTPSFSAGPDLVQLWCEGFYSFIGEGNNLVEITLTISKKGSSKSIVEYPIFWWSNHLYGA